MRIITFSFLLILISKITFAQDCVYTKSGYSFCTPYGCTKILKLKKYKLEYSSQKKLGSIKWQCHAYIAGKGLKKGKDTVIEGGKKIGEKILDKSGISSFLKGWGN